MSTLTPQEFVQKWRQVSVKERSGYQTHFNDLCALVGHDDPLTADPTGTWYAFEAGASKQSGGQGWADVWKKGHFALEYKGKHANLDKAYQQLLQYREALENPPLLVVSDMDVIEIHTNFTNTVKQVHRLTLDDLLTPSGQHMLRNIFFEPEAFRSRQTTAQVTEKAAAEFAKLAAQLRKWGEDPQRIAHFLIRLLFCLFAEDIGLLPTGLFSRLIERTKARPQVAAEYLSQLFAAMSKGGDFLLESIPWFNGRLFDDNVVLELDSDGLAIVERVSKLDWSSIEPAILGTLFERSLDETKRSQLGAHYTSRDDILLIVEPVLMQPLRRRWGEVQAQARELAQRRDQATGAPRTKIEKDLQRLIQSFQDELTETHVLDPACGSGNFLYVALKQLLDLEKEVITFAGDIGLTRPFPQVSPEQLHGIEINEYAHELAQITVWIGYLQWLRENGFGRPSEPILKPLDTIKHMDAILAFDEQGRPVEPEWPAATALLGNPPFLGGSRFRQGLGDSYASHLFKLYEGRVPGTADLVTYWFEKARQAVETGQVQRVGLLATQAIRAPVSRPVLERIKRTGNIFMAWSDRPWVLDGADVRVSMIGFDNGDEREFVLDGARVAAINVDLSSSTDLTIAQRLKENMDICFMGPSAKGPFEIEASLAMQMLRAPININGRPNSDVVRPTANASDLVQRSRQIWTIDFGLMSVEEAAFYELPFEYVKKHVYPVRSQNRRESYARKWWQYAEARPGMRQALKGKARYIATPAVSKHRVFVWVDAAVLANQKNLVFARDDDYFFGVLHSSVHRLWSLRKGSRHGVGNDPIYNNTACFETFPFPWPPGLEPQEDPKVQAIAQAARELVEWRDRWLNPAGASEAELKKRTLTNLYNERPSWLIHAHQQLDQAVFDAYGWPHTITDEEILVCLLTLNLERAAGAGAAPLAADATDDEADSE